MKLHWQATQGFSTRAKAREQQKAIAILVDPQRPGLRWKMKDIKKHVDRGDGAIYWTATHYWYEVKV